MTRPSKRTSRKSTPKTKSAPRKATAKAAAASSARYGHGTAIDDAPIPMLRVQTGSQRRRPIETTKSGQPVIGEPLPSIAAKRQSGGYGARGLRTKEIFWPDEREAVTDPGKEPYRWVCYLRSQNDSGGEPNRGTAFLIAPNLALTAAHCIYLPTGLDYLTVDLWPAHPGGVPSDAQAVRVSNVYAPQAWLDSHRTDRTADFAVLVLEQSVSNGYFGRAHYQDADFQNMLLNIVGFPFDRADNAMWEHSGMSTRAESGLIFHQIDTRWGQSGAPIFVIDNGKHYAVAIHTGQKGDNHGVRLNNDVLDLIDWFIAQHGT